MRLFRRGRIWYADLGEVGGKRLVSLRTADYDEAQDLYAALTYEARADRLGLEQRIERRRKPVLFEGAAQALLDYARTNLRRGSAERIEQVLRLHLEPVFRGQALHALGTEATEGYKRKRLAEGAAPGTINYELRTLVRLINLQVEFGNLTRSAVKLRQLKRTGPRTPRTLTPLELGALLAVAIEPVRSMLLVGVYTGLREGELFHLQWSRVDFRTRALLVDAVPGGWQPKTGAARTVPILDELAVEALEAQQARTREAGPWVWRGQKRTPITSIQTAWNRARQDAGLIGEHSIRWHDATRHTWATWALQAGYTMREVQTWGGWASLDMLEIYAHAERTALRSGPRRLSSPVEPDQIRSTSAAGLGDASPKVLDFPGKEPSA